MRKTVFFPGSFDPLTIGHTYIINKCVQLFDEVVVGIGINSTKNNLFTIQQRQKWIEKVFVDEYKVRTVIYEGLTVEACKKAGASIIVRGLRNTIDFEYEKAIAEMNCAMDAQIQTIFIPCLSELGAVSSTIVRDILKCNGDVTKFVPSAIKSQFKKK
jgi:pantetheine-phosphate adenylyltransferase